MNEIDKIWSNAKPIIVAAWKRSEDVGLPHNSKNLNEVLSAFDYFVSNVKALPAKHTDDQVLAEIEKLYATLNGINESFDHGLIETGERELLVPIVVDIATAAGVEADKYDGEPGGEFRDF